MSNRLMGSIMVAAVFAFAPIPAAGQAPAATTQAYVAPRTPNDQPDLQGIWQVLNSAAWDIQAHPARMKGEPAGIGVVEGNEIPYQAWAAAQKQENFENRLTADSFDQCFRPGVPRITYLPFPFQILQLPDMVVIVYEYLHFTRLIPTDGQSKHADPDVVDFWHGDSIGRWEGNTLVVDTTNFNGETWFDRAGNFHSDALHLVERYTRTGPDHITYEVTVEDPKVFTRPWKMSMPLYRRQEQALRLLEYECYVFAYEERGFSWEDFSTGGVP